MTLMKKYIINWLKQCHKIIKTKLKNSENSTTSAPNVFIDNLTGKINLKRSDKYSVLSNLSIYWTWKNIKKSGKNNKFKI